MARTEHEIETEARAAINAVIKEHKGIASRRIRPEFRKAFPFGPKASDKEKRVWEKMIERACHELDQWPKPLAGLILAIALSCGAAQAYPTMEIEGKTWALRGQPPEWELECEIHTKMIRYAITAQCLEHIAFS